MNEIVVGVDVGGPAKGFHAVALRGMTFVAKTHEFEPAELANWCLRLNATAVAVDAPCRWRAKETARAAERQMAQQGIMSYYAPTEARAREHAFYSWMLPGRALYDELASSYPLYLGVQSARMCIETFSHAVACALAGRLVSAKDKRVVRGDLLQRAGLPCGAFTNVDEIDAALCALAAQAFAAANFHAYGDESGGFIVVPAEPLGSATSEIHFIADSPVEAEPSPSRQQADVLGAICSLLPLLTASEKLQLRSHLEDM